MRTQHTCHHTTHTLTPTHKTCPGKQHWRSLLGFRDLFLLVVVMVVMVVMLVMLVMVVIVLVAW